MLGPSSGANARSPGSGEEGGSGRAGRLRKPCRCYADLVPFDELIRRTPGAHQIGSTDDLRCDAFDTEEEVGEFLAFVAESRHDARGS